MKKQVQRYADYIANCKKRLWAVGLRALDSCPSCFFHAAWKLLLGVYVDGFEMFGPTVGIGKRSVSIRSEIRISAPRPRQRFQGSTHRRVENAPLGGQKVTILVTTRGTCMVMQRVLSDSCNSVLRADPILRSLRQQAYGSTTQKSGEASPK